MMAVQKDGPPDLWGVTEMYEPESHIITARKFMPYIKVLTDCTGMKSHEVYKKCTKVFLIMQVMRVLGLRTEQLLLLDSGTGSVMAVMETLKV